MYLTEQLWNALRGSDKDLKRMDAEIARQRAIIDKLTEALTDVVEFHTAGDSDKLLHEMLSRTLKKDTTYGAFTLSVVHLYYSKTLYGCQPRLM